MRGYNSFPAKTVTAVVITNTADGRQLDGVDIATVYFKHLSEDDINELVKVGNVLKLAGGFTVEGEIWEKHIERMEGARDSVIGLPKKLTEQLMREAGY